MDKITKDQAAELCRILNEKIPDFVWREDLAAIGGGIFAVRQDLTPVMRVVRTGGRISLKFAPYDSRSTNIRVGNLGEYKGKGWVVKFADRLVKYLTEDK